MNETRGFDPEAAGIGLQKDLSKRSGGAQLT